MNSQIISEMNLLMSVNSAVSGTDQVKIVALLTKMLSSPAYSLAAKSVLDVVVNDSKFNLLIDLPRLIINLVQLNSSCDCYKIIVADRMQYLIYGVIYAYLLANNPQLLVGLDLGTFRVTYCNCIELVMMIPESLTILKTACSCTSSSNKITIE